MFKVLLILIFISTKIALFNCLNFLSSEFNAKHNLSVLKRFSSKYLIEQYSLNIGLLRCLTKCNMIQNCFMVLIKKNDCKLLNQMASYYLVYSANSSIYFKSTK